MKEKAYLLSQKVAISLLLSIIGISTGLAQSASSQGNMNAATSSPEQTLPSQATTINMTTQADLSNNLPSAASNEIGWDDDLPSPPENDMPTNNNSNSQQPSTATISVHEMSSSSTQATPAVAPVSPVAPASVPTSTSAVAPAPSEAPSSSKMGTGPKTTTKPVAIPPPSTQHPAISKHHATKPAAHQVSKPKQVTQHAPVITPQAAQAPAFEAMPTPVYFTPSNIGNSAETAALPAAANEVEKPAATPDTTNASTTTNNN